MHKVNNNKVDAINKVQNKQCRKIKSGQNKVQENKEQESKEHEYKIQER